MTLRQKLERLGSVAGGRQEPSESGDAREATLESLRFKIARLLAREAPEPKPRPERQSFELPFELVETAAGPLYRRIEAQRPSNHIGRMPIDSSRVASSQVLALLALDPTLAQCAARGALYLDCESTGLGGAGTLAFLVGLAWFDGEELVLEQLLLPSPADERPMLELIAERFERASMLVSFNGKTFDRPLLETRCVMNGLSPLAIRPHLDLLHVARRLHKSRLGSCRLVDLESGVLGFERGPDIDGAEVAARYGHFLRSGDSLALQAVVDHNVYDVLTMAALVGLYGEPLPALHDQDLVGLAETYRRAKALEEATVAAARAVERGVGAEALRLQGIIAKARGDRAHALACFERVAREVDDCRIRLELVKLYEHYVKEPARALSVLEVGTGESDEATARRRTRLQRKAHHL